MSEYKWKPFTLLVSAEEVKGNEMKIGDKYRFIGEPNKHGFYTKGKVYEITNIFEGSLYMEDNFGKSHSWNEESVNEKFEPASSPIRTVTRREIVAGLYGKVFINDYDELANTVSLNVKEDFGCVSFNAEELREAAHILNQIAEVLSDNET